MFSGFGSENRELILKSLSLFFGLVDTAVDGSGRHGVAGASRLVLQAVAGRNNGSYSISDSNSPITPPVSRQLQQQQQQQPPATTEPPRTLLRGILSQQPGASIMTTGTSGPTLGLVHLHSILQPGHPALRPAGPNDQPSYHHLAQQQLRHPSLIAGQHPHVKPGKL